MYVYVYLIPSVIKSLFEYELMINKLIILSLTFSIEIEDYTKSILNIYNNDCYYY